MLQPEQFEPNEAWIAFRLNDAPLHTAADGDFDFFALMDAASRLILGSATVSARDSQLSEGDARGLFDEVRAQAQALPVTLFVPDDMPAQGLAAEAHRLGITVVGIPLDQLLGFIGEARQSFRERFGTGTGPA
ncbi:hypothetical protein [Piscinibacter sakaiensis]|uniref:hypothetical protein n=1 Tax=Piscinibacter sakaiensis TaxID=1547922 RepID=UPI003AB023F4